MKGLPLETNRKEVSALANSGKKSILWFFLLVYGLSIPWWVLGLFLKGPGPFRGVLPDNFYLTDVVSSFVSVEAASILVYREHGLEGIKKLFSKTFDYKKIQPKVWWVPIVLLWPIQFLLTYEVMVFVGISLPLEWGISLGIVPLFVFYFVGATAEELGYTGYATQPMQERWGALRASLLLGSLWAMWHIPSMINVGQSLGLIVFGLLDTVSLRLLYVWLYNNSGRSVFGIILSHTVENVGKDLFPGGRTGFQLDYGAVGYSIVIASAFAVAILWDSKTLARRRYATKSAEVIT
jgi:hypothetical protein